jgi:hypothetical protein
VAVDLVHEPAIAAAPIGRVGPLGRAPLGTPAIEDDLDRAVARKRAFGRLGLTLPEPPWRSGGVSGGVSSQRARTDSSSGHSLPNVL